MKRLLRALVLLPLGGLAPASAPASAQAPAPAPARPYTALYVFGDSYSDTGAGILYGDGPSAVAYLAGRLHIPFTYYGSPESAGKSLNFAVSGGPSGTGTERTHGLRAQVDAFAALVASGQIHFDPARTLFFLEGGLNDSRLADGVTVSNLEGEIDTLYKLGGRRFQVTLLPEHIPGFAAIGKRLNPQLAAIPADMRVKYREIRITNSNWGPFYDKVIDHPADYGLTNTTDACASLNHQDGAKPCAAPDRYFYYYGAHPSTAAHKAVGDMLYTEALAQ